MISIALLIPTYNEAGNIERLLTLIAAQCQGQSEIVLEVFVIDDNSPDQTALLVSQIGPQLQSHQFVVHAWLRPRKEGLGKAYIDGFKRVLEQQCFDYILQMDADLSHDPAYLPYFFSAATQGTDLVIASRYLPGAAIPDWAWYRKFLSKAGNWFARTMLGEHITDYTGGFNMFATRILEQLNLNDLEVSGYGFLIKLKCLAAQSAQTIVNIPIIFIDRTHGNSKMPLSTMANNFFLVLHLWLVQKKLLKNT